MRFKRYLTAILLGCSLAMASSAQAQLNTDNIYVGLFGGAGVNFHTGTFDTRDGLISCGYFNDASSLRWLAGNYLEIPYSDKWMFSLRLFYQRMGAEFTTPTANPPKVSLGDGTLVTANTDQVLDTRLDYLNLALVGKYFFYKKWYAAIGPCLGYAVRADFTQKEKIISPAGLKFITGESERTILEGDFDNSAAGTSVGLRFSALAALGVDCPVGDRFVVNPEVSYNLAITKAMTPSDWRVNALNFTIGLKFLIGTQHETITIKEKEPVNDKPAEVIKPVKPLLPVASIAARNLMPNGALADFAEITVSDEMTKFVLPLLPYVFFAPNSGKIPERYESIRSGETGDFSENNFREPMNLYHNLLNIVGKRMNEYPDAKITVTGCLEPLEDTVAPGKLAQSRALAVKEYLTQVWRIASDRISIVEGKVPQVASNRNAADGREENRRAEITSTDERILAPVKGNLVSTTLIPESISIAAKVQYPEAAQSWSLAVKDADGAELFARSGSNAPDTAPILWNPNKTEIGKIARNINKRKNLTAQFSVASTAGDVEPAAAGIPVRYTVSSKLLDGTVVSDTIVERYMLLFFDFDKPTISKFNENTMSIIRSRIKTNSAVAVKGFTDRMGPEQHNMSLSTQRAETVFNSIRERIIPEKMTKAGLGAKLIYDNELPEGRMYNRTVVVEIFTPIDSY